MAIGARLVFEEAKRSFSLVRTRYEVSTSQRTLELVPGPLLHGRAKEESSALPHSTTRQPRTQEANHAKANIDSFPRFRLGTHS